LLVRSYDGAHEYYACKQDQLDRSNCVRESEFASIMMGLMVAKTGFIRMLPCDVDQATFNLVDKTLRLAVFLPASWTMPTIRVKTFRTTARDQ
jgi:hypothetical protein